MGEGLEQYCSLNLRDVFIILYHPVGGKKKPVSDPFSLERQCCALVIEKVSHLSTVPPWIINIEYTGAPLRFKGRRRGEGGNGRRGFQQAGYLQHILVKRMV